MLPFEKTGLLSLFFPFLSVTLYSSLLNDLEIVSAEILIGWIVFMIVNTSQESQLLEDKIASEESADIINKQAEIKEARSKSDKAKVVLNMAKWEAAKQWANKAGIRFRVVTEHEIFHKMKKKKQK